MHPPRIRPMTSSACLMKPYVRPQAPINDVVAAFRALTLQHLPSTRSFSASPTHCDWLAPKAGESRKSPKGRVHVPTGGSTKGTTVVWGDYGLRLRSHDRRIPAQNLKIAEDTIKKRLRGTKFRMYTRVSANIGVYTSGNESRMGKGKGSFDHWATRCATGKVVLELKGEVHEQVVRDAFRLAGNKLPGKS